MTTTNVNLVAKMEDGKTIIGESEIPEYAEKQNTYIDVFCLIYGSYFNFFHFSFYIV